MRWHVGVTYIKAWRGAIVLNLSLLFFTVVVVLASDKNMDLSAGDLIRASRLLAIVSQ